MPRICNMKCEKFFYSRVNFMFVLTLQSWILKPEAAFTLFLLLHISRIQFRTTRSTTNLPGGKSRPARKADKLAAMCEQIVYKV
jgi:hypothetical protein